MAVCVSRRQMVSIAVVGCFLAHGASASARIQYTLSVFQLLEHADIIVQVRPVGAGEFVVEEVLRGASCLEAELIRVDTREYDYCVLPKTGEEISVRHALLFLRRSRHIGNFDYELLCSGVRFVLSDDGKVLVPFERGYRPWGFRVDEQISWDSLLVRLRELLLIEDAMSAVFSDSDGGGEWVELDPSQQSGPLASRIVMILSRNEPSVGGLPQPKRLESASDDMRANCAQISTEDPNERPLPF